MLHTLLAMVMSINSFLVFLFILFSPFYCFIFQFYLNKDFTHNCCPFRLNCSPWTQIVVGTELTIGTTVTMVTVSCRYRARTEMITSQRYFLRRKFYTNENFQRYFLQRKFYITEKVCPQRTRWRRAPSVRYRECGRSYCLFSSSRFLRNLARSAPWCRAVFFVNTSEL